MPDEITLETEDVAARSSGDGMPIGNNLTPMIQPGQVKLAPDGITEPEFDDDAAATITWQDYQSSAAWLDTNSWLAEWQYVDYIYQSPTYDRDARGNTGRPARISRFNVAKNRNTMSTQIRRGVFADANPFVLEARGQLAGMKEEEQETYLSAITEIFSVLSDRADAEYYMGIFIECQVLQGTAIANPGWEERKVLRRTRERVTQPAMIAMPDGTTKEVDTWESDTFKVVEEEVIESWPSFEYRRLGTTFWDEGCRTPNRPELSAKFKIDVDFVTVQDLQWMRKLECYKDIPNDEDLKRYFLQNQFGDAAPATQTANSMNTQSTVVMHAEGEHKQVSADPFLRPMMKIARWTEGRVTEILVPYIGRMKTIRNGPHDLGDHALGYSGNWWNIDNSVYGMGVGRLNAGDQRMDQGVLNEVLKMIAFPMNAPILYDNSGGNSPTQNVVHGMGNFWGIDASKSGGDVNKAMSWMKGYPEPPADAWKVYLLGKDGGEDLVGANSTTMQGNLGGPGSSAMRTAAGVQRVGSKADDNVADPINQVETVLERWLQFLWRMIQEQMPPKEIREILSDKFGEAVVKKIDPKTLLNAKFNIKILAGQKLAAKQQIAQLIPFLLQLVQQPQLLEYMHQKGWTINFLSIERIFLRMSELQGAQDIIVRLTPEEMQNVQQMNPATIKAQIAELLEKLKGKNKLEAIDAQGKQEIQRTVIDKSMDHIAGAVPLDLAEARLDRNTDLTELQNGIPGTA
jgi:hypothetical protein